MAPPDWDGIYSLTPEERQGLFGKKPIKVITVPYELRRQTLARERDTIAHDIKISTGCVVIPVWEYGKISRFDIYGAASSAEKAVIQINQWISKAQIKSGASSAWAKISAFDPIKWYYDQVGVMERERKEIFRGEIPALSDDGPELFKIALDWPEDLTQDQSITPRDVFGNKLERLDSLRMQDEVWIRVLTPQLGLWQIEILAFDQNNLTNAANHFLTLIEKIRAEEMSQGHILNMILDDREGMDVVLQAAEVWWPNRQDRVVPRLLTHPMMGEPGSFRHEDIYDPDLSKIQHSIQLALEAVRHKRGSYDMAIRLGALAFSSKHVNEGEIGKIYTKDVFLKSVNGTVNLDVKKWLADNEVGIMVLKRLGSASDFLEPIKPTAYYGNKPDSLEQTRPTFRATWVFRDPASGGIVPSRATARHAGRPSPQQQQTPVSTEKVAPQAGLFVVQVDWTEDEDGVYEKSSPRFYKPEAGVSGPTKNMDINLFELGESRGWHFALESLEPVSADTVSPVLVGFAERVRMQPKYDVSSSKQFAQWEATPTIQKHLVTGRFEKTYSFGIKNTCYKVEMTATWYLKQELVPVWGLVVRHIAWATHLAELETLQMGCRAEWGHTVSTFLPDDGDIPETTFDAELLEKDSPVTPGTRILASLLMELSSIVSSVTGATGGVALF